VLNSFIETYASLFHLEMWQHFFSSKEAWGLIITLIILEGLLSADNALVLAIMVRKLPKEYQKKALFYGLLGAYVFRFLAIGFGVFLVKFWFVKLIGALYLFMIAFKFFKEFFEKRKQGEEEEEEEDLDSSVFERFRQSLMKSIGLFWATVASIELMDLAFSVDSILAALALVTGSGSSEFQVPVLLLGGFLGILMMRGVAGVFLKLLERVPELEVTAHVLIFLIATKMLLSIEITAIGFHGIHISHALFFGIIAGTFIITFIVHHFNKRKESK